ncbi:MAG: hypothetical protein ACJ786_20195 [Catenulispora sp.]|jgi:hypothetical protein
MPAPEPHPCPGSCGVVVPHHQLACSPCWCRLPKPLRDDVNDAYRNRRRDGALLHMRAVSKAYDWYRANPREVTG